VRKTRALLAVAVVLMREPDGRHWGYDISREAGIRSGVVYPLLKRLLEWQWLEDGWEDPTEIEGRPPRRYYTLTERGQRELGALAAQVPAPSPAAIAAKPATLRGGFAR
jgi:PadR family transcriptional regulator PadR